MISARSEITTTIEKYVSDNYKSYTAKYHVIVSELLVSPFACCILALLFIGIAIFTQALADSLIGVLSFLLPLALHGLYPKKWIVAAFARSSNFILLFHLVYWSLLANLSSLTGTAAQTYLFAVVPVLFWVLSFDPSNQRGDLKALFATLLYVGTTFMFDDLSTNEALVGSAVGTFFGYVIKHAIQNNLARYFYLTDVDEENRQLLNSLKHGIVQLRLSVDGEKIVLKATPTRAAQVILGDVEDFQQATISSYLLDKTTLLPPQKADLIDQTQQILSGKKTGFKGGTVELVTRPVFKMDGQVKRLECIWHAIPAQDSKKAATVLIFVRDISFESIGKVVNGVLETVTEREAIFTEVVKNSDSGKVMSCMASARDTIHLGRLDFVAPFTEHKVQILANHLHALKGNANPLDLELLTMRVHDLETVLNTQKKDLDALDTVKILQDLNALASLVDKYWDVMNNDLGWRESDLGVVQVEFETLKMFVDQWSLLGQATSGDLSIDLAQRDVLCKVYPRLQDIVTEVAAHLDGILTSLGKLPPRIRFVGGQVWFQQKHAKDLKDIFYHLMANALDHGLENATEREKAEKEAQGTIRIAIQGKTQPGVTITWSDNGKGLNIARIQEKAIKLGHLFSALQPPEEVAQAIFLPNVSSSAIVSLVSGRGWGMSDVKSKMEAMKGRVEIKVLRHIGGDYHAFELALYFPEEAIQWKS